MPLSDTTLDLSITKINNENDSINIYNEIKCPIEKMKDAKPKLIAANIYDDKKKTKNFFGGYHYTSYFLECLTIEFKYIDK